MKTITKEPGQAARMPRSMLKNLNGSFSFFQVDFLWLGFIETAQTLFSCCSRRDGNFKTNKNEITNTPK